MKKYKFGNNEILALKKNGQEKYVRLMSSISGDGENLIIFKYSWFGLFSKEYLRVPISNIKKVKVINLDAAQQLLDAKEYLEIISNWDMTVSELAKGISLFKDVTSELVTAENKHCFLKVEWKNSNDDYGVLVYFNQVSPQQSPQQWAQHTWSSLQAENVYEPDIGIQHVS